jgi:hypothetical protein
MSASYIQPERTASPKRLIDHRAPLNMSSFLFNPFLSQVSLIAACFAERLRRWCGQVAELNQTRSRSNPSFGEPSLKGRNPRVRIVAISCPEDCGAQKMPLVGTWKLYEQIRSYFVVRPRYREHKTLSSITRYTPECFDRRQSKQYVSFRSLLDTGISVLGSVIACCS